MRTLIFSNNKGGVRKTTLAYHSARVLSDRGFKVLGIDLDEQSQFVDPFDISPEDRVTLKDVIVRQKPLEKCLTQINENLYMLYSNTDIGEIDGYLHSINFNFQNVIYKQLEDLIKLFDFVIIDMPPGTTKRSACGYAFPDGEIITPVSTEINNIKSLKLLIDNVEFAKEVFNPSLAIRKVIMNHTGPALSKDGQMVIKFVKDKFDGLICPVWFRHSTDYAGSAARGKTIKEHLTDEKKMNTKGGELIEELDAIVDFIITK